MNTANKITMLRVVLIPIYMVLFLCDLTEWALGVFVLASVSDWLDGYIARNYNQVTDFGKFVDPLADKVLTTAAFLILLEKGIISSWVVMIILTREFMVAGIRMNAASEGKVIAASYWGKLKTVSQMVAVIAGMIMMLPVLNEVIGADLANLITNILVWISTALTVISGIDYLMKNRGVLKM